MRRLRLTFVTSPDLQHRLTGRSVASVLAVATRYARLATQGDLISREREETDQKLEL